ncbi:MAG: response regulator transcription factor [Rhodomicrobium sp.]
MPAASHILVVDDDPGVRLVLRQGLEAEGFAVSEASDKASTLARLKTDPISLITLDLRLGGQNGLEFAREIRAVRNVPIVMITGCDTPLDRVIGLEHGADDYITKPFHIREVVIRVKRTLSIYGALKARPAPVAEPRVHAFNNLCFDAHKQELRSANGAIIELTETELRLLELFLEYPGRVLSRDEITQLLRGHEWSPLDRMIDGHVSRLRRKVESPGGEETRLIRSVRGVGYVFAGDVKPR